MATKSPSTIELLAALFTYELLIRVASAKCRLPLFIAQLGLIFAISPHSRFAYGLLASFRSGSSQGLPRLLDAIFLTAFFLFFRFIFI